MAVGTHLESAIWQIQWDATLRQRAAVWWYPIHLLTLCFVDLDVETGLKSDGQ